MMETVLEILNALFAFGLMFISICLFALGVHISQVPKHIWEKARKSGSEKDLRAVMQYRRGQ